MVELLLRDPRSNESSAGGFLFVLNGLFSIYVRPNEVFGPTKNLHFIPERGLERDSYEYHLVFVRP